MNEQEIKKYLLEYAKQMYEWENLRKNEIDTNNITVPLTLILQTPVKFFNEIDLFAGGYYSYRFDGKQGNQAIDFEKTFTRHEGGITFGLDYYLKPIKFGQTWRIALTDFTRFANADNAHIRNITIYATITYTF